MEAKSTDPIDQLPCLRDGAADTVHCRRIDGTLEGTDCVQIDGADKSAVTANGGRNFPSESGQG